MALPDRVPPQNIEAEQAVLGAMMIKKKAIIEAQEILQPEDFYREAHRRVYDAMLKLAENDEAVDLVTLTEQLRKDGELEKIGGIPFITTIEIQRRIRHLRDTSGFSISSRIAALRFLRFGTCNPSSW